MENKNKFNFEKKKCPFCGKIFAESNLVYNFDIKNIEPTNRHICKGCKRSVLYKIELPK